jgi:predicted transcriptional regulator of viral defense system
METATQKTRATTLLQSNGIVRAGEFHRAGITATTLARLVQDGSVLRLARGLYQLPDAPLSLHQSLAEAAKRVSRGVICLVSALAFHELTDTLPSRVWLAIGNKDRLPRVDYPRLQVVRFPAHLLTQGVDHQLISGVSVPITDPTRTVVDLFRYRKPAGHRYRESPGINVAIEGLREALRQRKTTPAQLAENAREQGMWTVIQPYLEAMTANA